MIFLMAGAITMFWLAEKKTKIVHHHSSSGDPKKLVTSFFLTPNKNSTKTTMVGHLWQWYIYIYTYINKPI